MRKTRLPFLLMFVAIIITASSCSKDKVAGISTFQFNISPSDWVPNGSSGSSNYLYYVSYSLPEISQNVVDYGAVLGYVSLGTQWAALPYTETYSSYSVIYNYQYEAGTIFIVRKDTDLYTIPPVSTISVKIIVMPEYEKDMLQGVDISDYEQVKKVLDLK